jgi:DNA-binding NtrC family response regulator
MIASADSELLPTTSRDDLLTRLRRISLFLPPVRERRMDIPILIRHLLDKHASEHDGPARRLADETLVYLWQYDWPGNLRELAEVVRESATAAAEGIVHPGCLPVRIRCSLRQGSPAGNVTKLSAVLGASALFETAPRVGASG